MLNAARTAAVLLNFRDFDVETTQHYTWVLLSNQICVSRKCLRRWILWQCGCDVRRADARCCGRVAGLKAGRRAGGGSRLLLLLEPSGVTSLQH